MEQAVMERRRRRRLDKLLTAALQRVPVLPLALLRRLSMQPQLAPLQPQQRLVPMPPPALPI
jgi:hypothetical protein